MAWTVQPSETFKKRLQTYSERYPETKTRLMWSVNRYWELLNRDVDPYSPQISFLEKIRSGIVAISEEETPGPDRVYAFPDGPNHVVHLLSMGHRNDEATDLVNCDIQVQRLQP